MHKTKLFTAVQSVLQEYDKTAMENQKFVAANGNGVKKNATAFDMMARQPWAMLPGALEVMASIARRENESPEALATKLGRPLQSTRDVTVRDGVAILPVSGPIFRHANLFTEISGATSLEILARDFATAANDPAIKSIVLDMGTPGGQATGIAEFAHQVRSADVRVVAYVGDMAASAGYWIASAADEIVISKTGEVGSIGAVVGMYTGNEDGYTEIVSSQSPKKRPDVATEDGREQIQTRIDALAQVFVDDVADYRGVNNEKVLADFGQGDMRMGEEAVRLGMADRVSTLEDLIADLADTTTITGDSIPMSKEIKSESGAADQPITREFLTENHPAIVQAIEHDAATAATTVERQRVQGIIATPLANIYGEEVSASIESGETAGQLASTILAAESKGRVETLEHHKKDAPAPVAEPVSNDKITGNDMSIDVRCKAQWDKSSKLREEHNGDFENYLAYETAASQGLVRVLGKTG